MDLMKNEERMEKEREIQARNAFAAYNLCEVVDVRKDFAEVRLKIVPESLNFHGNVHGGAYFTMADMCAGVVCRTDGRLYVTQQANVQFVRAVEGGTLLCRGSVLHRGRTSCLVEIRITKQGDPKESEELKEEAERGKTEEPVFLGTFLFHCISA